MVDKQQMFQADSAKAEDKRDKIAANIDKLRNQKKMFEDLDKKWPQFEAYYDLRITKLEQKKAFTIEKMKTTNEKLKSIQTKFTDLIDWSVSEESKGLELVPLFEENKDEILSKLLTAPHLEVVKIFDEEINKC